VPLVVHYWADLQSVHGFRCYDNKAENAECQRVLVSVTIQRYASALYAMVLSVHVLVTSRCSQNG